MRRNLVRVVGIRALIQTLVGLVVVGGLGGVTPACLVTGVPDFDDPEGTLAKGSCMCAMCLDKPFCMDEARTTTKVDDGTCVGDPDHPLMSVETASVADPAHRSGSFFCIPDDGKVLPVPTAPRGCPDDPTQAGQFANVNECIDLPVACIDPAIVTSVCGKKPNPTDPPCPEGAETGPVRTACAPPIRTRWVIATRLTSSSPRARTGA